MLNSKQLRQYLNVLLSVSDPDFQTPCRARRPPTLGQSQEPALPHLYAAAPRPGRLRFPVGTKVFGNFTEDKLSL